MELPLIPYPKSILFSEDTYYPPVSFSPKQAVRITDESLKGEHYRLKITPDGIIIYAGTQQGFYRGKTTLTQILCNNRLYVPCMTVDDEPQFAYRGFHIDSARHMQSIEELESIIDAAALFKFNYFHWHLSDDQGYRIESERFPELNVMGSFRESSDFGRTHINERYGGFYTKDEIRRIVSYCAHKYIEVVPEIEMPGHTSAILHTFPSLSCTGISPGVKTTAGIFKDVMCPGKNETLDFVYELIDEVAELFPCEYFHIGGDETPKNRWNNCPACKARMEKEELADAEKLQLWFTDRVTGHLAEIGKKAICWNETLKGGTPANSPVIQNWMDKDMLCPGYAENGGKVIISDFYHYYCDYPYSMTPLKKTYNFNPYMHGLSKAGKNNILGVEAALWTEYVSDFRRLTYLAYPRFAAVAETGWSEPRVKYYKSFHRRFLDLQQLLFRMWVVPAAESEWNPRILSRGIETIKFFSGNLNKDMIANFFLGDENN